MSELIETETGEVPYGHKCPNCGSTNTVISEDSLREAPNCPWCKDCGHGWMESN